MTHDTHQTANNMTDVIETSFSKLSAWFGPSDTAAWWTLHMAFNVHRAGILMVIDKGKLAALIPFVNTQFDNRLAFAGARPFTLHGSGEAPSTVPLDVTAHYAQKAEHTGTRPEHVLVATHTWWLNGHLVCNVASQALWSLRGLSTLRAMVSAALQCPGAPPRARLILNKRDTPMLKADGSSPFDALCGWQPLALHHMWKGVAAYVAPLSLYSGPAFADVLLPTPDHWELAATAATYEAPPWHTRQARAVFRGTATGPGSSQAHNQRLQLGMWGAHHTDIADVGLTALSYRDRVVNGAVTFMDVRALDAAGIRRVPAMSPTEQARAFKYQIYADGHCASSRLAWLLLSGSLVLRIASPPTLVAPHMWFTERLQPHVHYLPVRADLSDLADVVRWAILHDAAAQAIAVAGRALALATFQPAELAAYTAAALARAVSHPVTWHKK